MSSQVKLYGLTFAASTVFAIYYSFYSSEISILYMMLLLVSATMLAVLSSTVLVVEREMIKYSEYFTDFEYEKDICIFELFDSIHRPTIMLLPNSTETAIKVGLSVRNLIHNDGDDTIVFLGAASLQTPPEGTADGVSSIVYDDEENESPHQVYQGALEEATSKKANMIRYARLPSVDDVKNRSRDVRSDYTRWLRNQISQLERNENYFLVNSPRAPKWGAAGARIISGEDIFDLTHKNGAAIYIRDATIAQSQAEIIRKGVFSGKIGNIRIYNKNSDGISIFGLGASGANIKDLKKELADLLTAIKNPN